MRELRDRVSAEVGKVVVGQDDVVDLLLAAVAVSGHVLLEGVPGVAKTLLANATARALGVSFRRVQFTPDMLPSDLTGTMTLRGQRTLGVPAGPGVHARAAGRRDQPHAAQDPGRVARGDAGAPGVGRRRATSAARPVPRGRDPEPDRVRGHVPAARGAARPVPRQGRRRLSRRADEVGDARGCEHRGVAPATLDDVEPVASADELLAARDEVDATTVADEVRPTSSRSVRRTRELPSVALGASPRAAVHLLAASKASARISGRDFVTPDDVAWMARPVLRHRLLLRPEAELERYRPDDAVQAALCRRTRPAEESPMDRTIVAAVALSRRGADRLGRRARQRHGARRPAVRRGCAVGARVAATVALLAAVAVAAAFVVDAVDEPAAAGRAPARCRRAGARRGGAAHARRRAGRGGSAAAPPAARPRRRRRTGRGGRPRSTPQVRGRRRGRHALPAPAARVRGPLGLGGLVPPGRRRRPRCSCIPTCRPRGGSRSRCGRAASATPAGSHARPARARHRLRVDPRLPARRRHPPGQLACDGAARPADEQPVPGRAGPRRRLPASTPVA